MDIWLWVALWSLVTYRTAHSVLPQYRAVAGQTADLPCNLSVPTRAPSQLGIEAGPPDAVSLVLWYRGEAGAPIYIVDARRHKTPRHFPGPERGRLDFDIARGVLRMSGVSREDEGEYRCRVDYRYARTAVSALYLHVVVPPTEVIITNEAGRLMKDSLPPVNEGETIKLICRTKGGRPPAKVRWQRNGRPMLGAAEVLEVRATRDLLLANITCLASNNNITAPVQSSVTIELNLRPLSATVSTEPLEAGRSAEVSCAVTGSRPEAHVTWWLDGERLGTGPRLPLALSRRHHGKILTCRATNPRLSATTIVEESITLDVAYPPEVKLETQLDGPRTEVEVKEGEELRLTCRVDANPEARSTSWTLDGRHLPTDNPAGGVIAAGTSLALLNIRRDQTGGYSCEATNSQGSGQSAVLRVSVLHAPVCRPGQRTTYGATRRQDVVVTCEIEARPPEVTFRWAFNGTTPRTITAFNSQGLRSLATYTPEGPRDYGPLLCWADNIIGPQRRPCVFHIVPTGLPSEVEVCVLTNQTSSSLTVFCRPSPDDEADFELKYDLEVREADGPTVVSNITGAPSPRFHVPGLTPNSHYLLAVFASGPRGRGPPCLFPASTLPSNLPSTQAPPSKELSSSPSFRQILIICGVAGSALATLFVCVRVCRGHRGLNSISEEEKYDHLLHRNFPDNNEGESVKWNGVIFPPPPLEQIPLSPCELPPPPLPPPPPPSQVRYTESGPRRFECWKDTKIY